MVVHHSYNVALVLPTAVSALVAAVVAAVGIAVAVAAVVVVAAVALVSSGFHRVPRHRPLCRYPHGSFHRDP